MSVQNTPEDNRLCLRLLTPKRLAKMHTYNYAGFVGQVHRKGDLYIVEEVTGRTNIVGSGETVEVALYDFEAAVRRNLKEQAHDSQRKMLLRRFAKMEEIHSRVNKINRAALKRRVDRASRMENRS